MKKSAIGMVVAWALLASWLTASGSNSNSVETLKAAADAIEKEKDALAVKQALVVLSESPQVVPYFENSYGVAVFPTIGKGGLGIGGAHGKGWVFRQGNLVGESTMTQLTIGFQAGGQAFSQIIFFEDEHAFDDFTSGNFEFGAQASAVVLTAGANVQASTAGGSNAGIGNAQAKTDYTGGMAVFVHAKGGLMYEAAIGGQKFSYKPLE